MDWEKEGQSLLCNATNDIDRNDESFSQDKVRTQGIKALRDLLMGTFHLQSFGQLKDFLKLSGNSW